MTNFMLAWRNVFQVYLKHEYVYTRATNLTNINSVIYTKINDLLFVKLIEDWVILWLGAWGSIYIYSKYEFVLLP